MAQVRVTVDGVNYADEVEPRTLLVYYLRERLGKTGTLVGCLTLGYLQKVLSLNAYSTEMRLMLTGAIIVAAVLIQRRADRE